MTKIRPDENKLLDILNTETDMQWTQTLNKPNKLTFISGILKLEIVWDSEYWTLNLYDISYGYGKEPKWALGPIKTGSNVENELGGFIPDEFKVEY